MTNAELEEAWDWHYSKPFETKEEHEQYVKEFKDKLRTGLIDNDEFNKQQKEN